MIRFFQFKNGSLSPTTHFENAFWVDLINPSEKQVTDIIEQYHLDPDLIYPVLDTNERSRVEVDTDLHGKKIIMIIIRASRLDPYKRIPYISIPLAFILTATNIITLSLMEVKAIHDIRLKLLKKSFSNTHDLLLSILYSTATIYLQDLQMINQSITTLEATGLRLITNKELYQLLNVQKSLVYFATALRANEIVMERLLRSSTLKGLSEEQKDLLESIIIENKQAIEMSQVYTNILSNIMTTFASFISNNISNTMKILTSVSIILMLSSVILGLFSMNVALPLSHFRYAFWVIIFVCILACVGVFLIFTKNKYLSK